MQNKLSAFEIASITQDSYRAVSTPRWEPDGELHVETLAEIANRLRTRGLRTSVTLYVEGYVVMPIHLERGTSIVVTPSEAPSGIPEHLELRDC